MDHPNIRYAASIIGSHASRPKDADIVKLKRVVRFLLGRPTTWTHYRWDVRSDLIKALTDSDWAANREDKRLMSGGMLVHSGGLLRFWSKRLKAASMSSWEIELYDAVSTGVEAFVLKIGVRDLGNSTCDECIRQPKRRGPHSTTGTWVGEARAHETSLAARGEG